MEPYKLSSPFLLPSPSAVRIRNVCKVVINEMYTLYTSQICTQGFAISRQRNAASNDGKFDIFSVLIFNLNPSFTKVM